MPHPWDQLPGEPDEAYARFLTYRDLGPSRSLRRAHRRSRDATSGGAEGNERQHLPGHWTRDSAHWRWPERAAAWDVKSLATYGARVAVLHVTAVTLIAQKCARKAAELSPGDKGWPALLETVRLVGEYLTPEVIRGIHEHQESAEPVADPVRPAGA